MGSGHENNVLKTSGLNWIQPSLQYQCSALDYQRNNQANWGQSVTINVTNFQLTCQATSQLAW